MPETRTCDRCGRLKAWFYRNGANPQLRCPVCAHPVPSDAALQPLRDAVAVIERLLSQA